MKPIKTKLFDVITNKVKDTARTFDQNSEVFLFGSRARGDYKKNSDWDFLILMNKQINEQFKEEVRAKIYDTELDTDQLIFSLVENIDDWNKLSNTDLFLNIKEDAIKL
jgi:uncharacterized protein